MKRPKKLSTKLRRPKLPKGSVEAVKAPFQKARSTEEKVSDALSNVPRITNETVGEHREEVLAGARKFIYPLQHSKHRVVRISLSLFALVVIAFFTMVGLSLYKFQSTGGFIYDVTRIMPFPVAKAGDRWISYESYLFELRRNMHYYQTQQQTDFSSKDGKEQLKRLKRQALDQVVQDAYVKQLAASNGVSVSNQAVDNQVALVRSQNRLGNNDRVFRDVLKEFWGWSEADFKRELKQQLLQQAVVTKLDKNTTARAESALRLLKQGTDFAAVATQASDDASTKASGGQYPAALTINNRDLPPALTATVFRLKPGQISDIVNTGYTLEIVKLNEISPGGAKVSHIQFNLVDITTYVKPLQAKKPGHQYIKL